MFTMVQRTNDFGDLSYHVSLPAGLLDHPDHYIIVWDTGKRDNVGRKKIACLFYRSIDEHPFALFANYMYIHATDPRQWVIEFLFWVTLHEGDTDEETFERHTITEAQRRWRKSDLCEALDSERIIYEEELENE